MEQEVANIVEKLGMQKLWDDDFIKENYCSNIFIHLDQPKRTRPLFNWAYYLIPEGCIFPLHKLLSDESWQYCLGGPVDLLIVKNGEIEKIRIGPNIFKDEKLFYIVEKNTWFAATPAPSAKYTLITHCVAPGWHPADDIPGYYEDMIKLIPNYVDFAKQYSWPIDRNTYTTHEAYKDE